MIAWTDSLEDSAPGEALVMNEKLVIAPCSGRFRPAPRQRYTSEGDYVLEGQVVGNVVSNDGEVVPVRSPFAGWMMGFLLPDGAPVQESEPVVWLRSH
ncbi:MAG: hypothetical protein M3164_07100 [Actinomycetota bacterium]|nr:hypothetical protein [Actinomycetota bacterium]